MARVIVFGNEKGGCGKSTVAMHLGVLLLRQGGSVGVIDLDVRQRSVTRFFENRQAFADRKGVPMVMPRMREVEPSRLRDREEAAAEDAAALAAAVESLSSEVNDLVIDTPGASTSFSGAAHQRADHLVTPINDSFVDLDMLARVNPEDGRIVGPSRYTDAVWSARQWRAERGLPPLQWTVMRNRMANLDARNQRRMCRALEEFSRQMGFRVATGFRERVIFRELFLNGLTLLDLADDGGVVRFTLSHVAARQELRALATGMGLIAGDS